MKDLAQWTDDSLIALEDISFSKMLLLGAAEKFILTYHLMRSLKLWTN